MNIKKFLLYVLFTTNLLGVLYIWFAGSGSMIGQGASPTFISIGRLTGLLAELFILVQLVLVGRIRFIEQVFGFDKLNKLHKKVGFWIGSTILIHPLSLITGYSLANNTNAWVQYLSFLKDWDDVLLASIGLLILLTAIGFSVAIVRRKLKYETWYFTHLFIYVAIVLFFNHQVNFAEVSYGPALYYWYILNFTVFGLVLLYRFMRPLYLLNRHRFYVDRIVPETYNVNSFYIKGKHLDTYAFRPGQYMHITFFAKKMWYTHPFSFSAAPNGQNIRVSIKSSGDFTNTIHTVPVGTKVMIDGPFGVFTEKSATMKTNKFLFIAGGIGITPLRALAESLSKKHKDVMLLYGNRSEQDIAFKTELEAMPIKIYHILSEKPAGSTDATYKIGYVDQAAIVELCPDFISRDIYVCGPPVMMTKVVTTLRSMGIHDEQLHFEEFSY